MRGVSIINKSKTLLVLLLFSVFASFLTSVPAKAQIPGPGVGGPPKTGDFKLYLDKGSGGNHSRNFSVNVDSSGQKYLKQMVGVASTNLSTTYKDAAAIWTLVETKPKLTIASKQPGMVEAYKFQDCPSFGPYGIFKFDRLVYFDENNQEYAEKSHTSANYYIMANLGASGPGTNGATHDYDCGVKFNSQEGSVGMRVYTGGSRAVDSPLNAEHRFWIFTSASNPYTAYPTSTLNWPQADGGVDGGFPLYNSVTDNTRDENNNFTTTISLTNSTGADKYIYLYIRSASDFNMFDITQGTNQQTGNEYEKYYKAADDSTTEPRCLKLKLAVSYYGQSGVNVPRGKDQLKYISDMTTELRSKLVEKLKISGALNNNSSENDIASQTWPLRNVAGYNIPDLLADSESTGYFQTYYKENAQYPNKSISDTTVFNSEVSLIATARNGLFANINTDETKKVQNGILIAGIGLGVAMYSGPAAPFVAGGAAVLAIAELLSSIADANARREAGAAFVRTIYAVAYSGSVLAYDTCVRDYWKNAAGKGETSEEYTHMNDKVTQATANITKLKDAWAQGAADLVDLTGKSQTGYSLGNIITDALMYVAKLIHKGIIWFVSWIIRWTSGVIPI